MEAKEEFMNEAIKVASQSAKEDNYAIGAVIVKDGSIIASGMTSLNGTNDPTLHAEIVAIRNACKAMSSRFLEGCVLYTTHEPCPMCSSAAVWAKMEGIVFGATIGDAKEKQSGKFSWRQMDISCKEILSKGTPKLGLIEGFCRDECNKLFTLSK